MIPSRRGKALSAFADNLGGALMPPAAFPSTLVVPRRNRKSVLSVTIPHFKKGSAFSTRGSRSHWLFEVFHRHRKDEDGGELFARLYRQAFDEHKSHRKAVIVAESLLADMRQTGEFGAKALERKRDSLGRENCYQDGEHVACDAGAKPANKAKKPAKTKKVKAPAKTKKVKAPAKTKKPSRSKPVETTETIPSSASQPASDKAARAKASHVLVDKEIQRYAEEYNEPRMAALIKGWSLKNSEPQDLENEEILVELKTMVKKKAGDKDIEITMDSYSQVRKVNKEKETGKPFHTIVSDDRLVFNAIGEGKHDETKRVYYYRRGVAGSASVMGMCRADSDEELLRLIATPDDELPDSAKRRDGKHFAGNWEFGEDDQGKFYKNDETGKIFRAKK